MIAIAISDMFYLFSFFVVMFERCNYDFCTPYGASGYARVLLEFFFFQTLKEGMFWFSYSITLLFLTQRIIAFASQIAIKRYFTVARARYFIAVGLIINLTMCFWVAKDGNIERVRKCDGHTIYQGVSFETTAVEGVLHIGFLSVVFFTPTIILLGVWAAHFRSLSKLQHRGTRVAINTCLVATFIRIVLSSANYFEWFVSYNVYNMEGISSNTARDIGNSCAIGAVICSIALHLSFNRAFYSKFCCESIGWRAHISSTSSPPTTSRQ